MTRPGGRATRVHPRASEARQRYAYQVRMNWLRLYGTDPREVLGVIQWDKLLRQHYHLRVLPMDAARSIHATEVNE